MKRLPWFSAVLAACFSAALAVAQVGAPVAGASGPPAGSYTSAQRIAAAQGLATGTILCKSGAAVSAPVDTTEDVLYTCTVPAATLGLNGQLRVSTVWTTTSSANTKTLRIRYNGAAGTTFMTQAFGATTGVMSVTTITNRNSTSSQVGASSGTSAAGGVAATATQTAAVDTTASTSVVVSCQKALNSETCTLESILVEALIDGA